MFTDVHLSQDHEFLKKLLNPVVLCGRETCYLALRVHYRLRVFENRAERKIFRPKSEEVTEGWGKKKLVHGKLHDRYFSPGIFRVIRSRIDGLRMQPV